MTIGKYLDTLCLELEGRMPDDVADQRLLELETHLNMATSAHLAEGMSQEDSEKQSIADLGDVKVVADELVRQHLGYKTAPARKLILSVAPFVVLAMGIPYYYEFWMFYRSLEFFDWLNVIDGVVTWTAIAFMVITVWRTRRWLAGTLALWSLLVSIVVIFSLHCFSISQETDADWERGQRRNATSIARMLPDLEAITRWRDGHAPTDRGPVRTPFSAAWGIPMLPLPWIIQRASYSLVSMTPVDSARAWSRYGMAFSDQEDRALHSYWDRKSMNRWSLIHLASQFFRSVSRFALTYALGIGLLYAWNGAILVIAGVRDRIRNLRQRTRLFSEPRLG